MFARRIITYCMHRAVADGPNHSPGYLPHAVAPYLTKLCREYGARGSSAKRAMMSFSASKSVPRLHSIPVLLVVTLVVYFCCCEQACRKEQLTTAKASNKYSVC